jgi:hypothetical protein
MPSKTLKQHKFMEAVANSPAFAKKVGIKQSVGKDFAAADKGKTFKGGGMALFKGKETYGEELKEAKSLKSGKISPAGFVKGEKSEGNKNEENPSLIAKEIKSGAMSPMQYASAESKEPKKMATGGYVRSADGIATKGKTKGRII